MKFKRFTVSFEWQDMRFLKKHGLFKASRKVKNHFKKTKTLLLKCWNKTFKTENYYRINTSFHQNRPIVSSGGFVYKKILQNW